MINLQINNFLNGKVILPDSEKDISSIPWNKHSVCEGVALKHLVTGCNTNNKFSCHIVKIEPQCSIIEHEHDNKWELHEVIEGAGYLTVNDNKVNYDQGISVVIPENQLHSITAGNEGLLLFAKFIPALL